MPVVLPPLPAPAVAELIERLDGICLSGGPDLDPIASARARHAESADGALARRVRARARARGRPPRHAPARDLPRRPDAQRRPRRHAASSTLAATARRSCLPAQPRRPGSRCTRASGACSAAASSPSTPSTTRRWTSSARGCACRRAPTTGRWRPSSAPSDPFLLGVQWHAETLVDRRSTSRCSARSCARPARRGPAPVRRGRPREPPAPAEAAPASVILEGRARSALRLPPSSSPTAPIRPVDGSTSTFPRTSASGCSGPTAPASRPRRMLTRRRGRTRPDRGGWAPAPRGLQGRGAREKSCPVLEHQRRAVLRAYAALRRGGPDVDRPPRRFVEAGDQLQQRALAAAGRPDETHELVALDVERHPVEREDGRPDGPVRLRDVTNGDDGVRPRRRRVGRSARIVARHDPQPLDLFTTVSFQQRVQGREVVDPLQVDRFEEAERDGVVLRLLERRRDRIDGERQVLPRLVEHFRRDRLRRDLLDAVVDDRLRLVLVLVDERVRLEVASSSALTWSGCCLRYSVRTMRCVVTYRPFGHRSRSSTSTLPPPSSTRRVAHGSGTHAPAMSPDWNVSRLTEFSCGSDLDVATAGRRRLEPSSLSHARSATSCVLPSCGVATFLPFRSRGVVDRPSS